MSKVSIIKCKNYNTKAVEDAVFRAVDLLGGIGNFVKSGDTVLIKPNLLSGRNPDEAVTTHPEVVRAVIRLIGKTGAKILVGDSPGTFFTTKNVDDIYDKTGIARVVNEEKAELVRLDKPRIVNSYPISEAALNVSSIISLPKLKTHALTVMTGGIKNTFGLIPGHFKVECHRKKPRSKEFVKLLLDIYEIAKPKLSLSIMDGIVAMEGDGPAAGTPKGAGLILASADAVSLDAVVSELVSIPSYKDIVMIEAKRRDAGEANKNNIEVAGETIADTKIKDFKLPKTYIRMDMLPDFIVNMVLGRFIRFKPVIDESICKKCEVCKNGCPVDAITINEDTSRINDKVCIRCFCCSEVCPYNAVFIKKGLIAGLLWRE
jgi:uncharacterized protein (DUF362 family)/NAD-dependent dihydropyrimidine dehydrogenase PreA subunit